MMLSSFSLSLKLGNSKQKHCGLAQLLVNSKLKRCGLTLMLVNRTLNCNNDVHLQIVVS